MGALPQHFWRLVRAGPAAEGMPQIVAGGLLWGRGGLVGFLGLLAGLKGRGGRVGHTGLLERYWRSCSLSFWWGGRVEILVFEGLVVSSMNSGMEECSKFCCSQFALDR